MDYEAMGFTRDFFGNYMKPTETPHIYEVANGKFMDDWGEPRVGNFITFDECGMFNTIHDTYEEAQEALKAYCLYLDGRYNK